MSDIERTEIVSHAIPLRMKFTACRGYVSRAIRRKWQGLRQSGQSIRRPRVLTSL